MSKEKLKIINRALIKIGENTIDNLKSDTTEGIVSRSLYQSCVNQVLSLYHWSFSIKIESLNKALFINSKMKNSFKNKFFFSIPKNCLRIISVFLNNYEIIGNIIVVNKNSVEIKYISKAEEFIFPQYFEEVIVAKLASEMSISLANSIELSSFFERQFEILLQTAKSIDSQQKNPPVLKSNILIEDR